MRMHRKLGSMVAAALSAGAAVALTAVPGQPALASASPMATGTAGIGGIGTAISGVPAHLAVGGGFTATITVSSTSSYFIVVEDLYIGMWNLGQGGFSQTEGITVAWKDPATGQWRGSDNVDSNGGWGLMPGGQVEIPPHGTLSYQVHIAMSGEARQGTEHLDCSGVSAWSLVDGNGDQPPTQTLDYNQAQTTFTFGSGSAGGGNPGGGNGPTTPTTSQAERPVQAAPSPSPSSAAPSPSATTQSQSPTPAAPSTTAPAANAPVPAAAHSTPPSQVDTTATSESGDAALPLALVGLLIVTGTAVGMLMSRRMRSRA
jgi:hypothetical protein